MSIEHDHESLDESSNDPTSRSDIHPLKVISLPYFPIIFQNAAYHTALHHPQINFLTL